jgi:hypothetical protein
VLIAFKGNTQALDMLNINVAKHTFAFVNESLSILELRVELEDGKEGVTPTDLGVTNNNIHLAKGTTQIGEGVNVKTINGETLLGSGNIVVGDTGTVDDELDDDSVNPVQNKVVTEKFDEVETYNTSSVAKIYSLKDRVSPEFVINGYKLSETGVDTDNTRKLLRYNIFGVVYIKTNYGYQFRTGQSATTTLGTFIGEYEGFLQIPSNANYLLIDCDSDDDTKGIYNVRDNLVKNENVHSLRVNSTNLLSSFTIGDGWSGDLDNGFTHTEGVAGNITFSTSANQINAKYLVTFNVSAMSTAENSLMVKLGDKAFVDTYSSNLFRYAGFIGDGNSTLVLKASAEYGNISITNIKVREVTGYSTDEEVILPWSDNIYTDNLNDSFTGWWNVALGEEALTKNINGSRNIGVGYGSLHNMYCGTRNIGIGTFSLTNMQYGDHNIAIGSDTGYRTTFSDDNVMIGYSVMAEENSFQNTNNVAIGSRALHVNDTSVNWNVAIGSWSGCHASNYNTYVGAYSGYYSNGQYNVALGYNAYSDVYTTGSFNIIIGANAGVSGGTSETPTTITDSIVIGNGVKASKSHQTNIGALSNVEVIINGQDIIFRNTSDWSKKKLIFNEDNSVTWETIQ